MENSWKIGYAKAENVPPGTIWAAATPPWGHGGRSNGLLVQHLPSVSRRQKGRSEQKQDTRSKRSGSKFKPWDPQNLSVPPPFWLDTCSIALCFKGSSSASESSTSSTSSSSSSSSTLGKIGPWGNGDHGDHGDHGNVSSKNNGQTLYGDITINWRVASNHPKNVCHLKSPQVWKQKSSCTTNQCSRDIASLGSPHNSWPKDHK